MAKLLVLEEMQSWIAELRGDVPLDEVPSEAHVKILGAFRKLVATPGMLDFLHEYMMGQAEKDE